MAAQQWYGGKVGSFAEFIQESHYRRIMGRKFFFECSPLRPKAKLPSEGKAVWNGGGIVSQG